MTASQTAPTTNDTATIIDEHRIIGTVTGTTGIAIECNCGHRSMTSTNDYLDAPISSDWNPRRDAEHLHAEHVAKNLAAQQGPALLAALTPEAREHWESMERDRAKHNDRGCSCDLCASILAAVKDA